MDTGQLYRFWIEPKTSAGELSGWMGIINSILSYGCLLMHIYHCWLVQKRMVVPCSTCREWNPRAGKKKNARHAI